MIPDTTLAKEARALARAAAPEWVFNHSVRSFLLAQAWARKKALASWDEEGLWVAAMFHDLGLGASHRTRALPFQVASSRAMRTFLEERRVPRERISQLVDAIDWHLQLLPRWSLGETVGLLQVGTWMDVTLLRRWSVRAEARAIAAEWPRAGLDVRFPLALARSMLGIPGCLGLLFPGPWRSGS